MVYIKQWSAQWGFIAVASSVATANEPNQDTEEGPCDESLPSHAPPLGLGDVGYHLSSILRWLTSFSLFAKKPTTMGKFPFRPRILSFGFFIGTIVSSPAQFYPHYVRRKSNSLSHLLILLR